MWCFEGHVAVGTVVRGQKGAGMFAIIVSVLATGRVGNSVALLL